MKALYNFNTKISKTADQGGGSGGGYAPKTVCPRASGTDKNATNFDLKKTKRQKVRQ